MEYCICNSEMMRYVCSYLLKQLQCVICFITPILKIAPSLSLSLILSFLLLSMDPFIRPRLLFIFHSFSPPLCLSFSHSFSHSFAFSSSHFLTPHIFSSSPSKVLLASSFHFFISLYFPLFQFPPILTFLLPPPPPPSISPFLFLYFAFFSPSPLHYPPNLPPFLSFYF